MPQSTDLVGLGVPPSVAGSLGNDPIAVTAAGSAQAGATVIRNHMAEMTATGADGIVFPTNAKIGTPYYVFNSSGSTGLVYVPVGHTLNTTLNGSLSMVTHKMAIFIQYKNKFWSSVLTA